MNSFANHLMLRVVQTSMAIALIGGFLMNAETPSKATPSRIKIDGQLDEPEWNRCYVLRDFTFPWASRKIPATEFRAMADAETFYFSYTVKDDDVVLVPTFEGKRSVVKEDRVEIFFSKDPELKQYYCLEIDPLGRVLDYSATSYRKFDQSWKCEGLQVAGVIQPDGYVVEGSIPLRVLSSLLGHSVAPGKKIHVGFFRAEFRKGSTGDDADDWLSWIKPQTTVPDFHVPSAFSDWEIPGMP